MAAMGIDGLVSGLDTTALITSLMQAEAMPQTLLKSKVTSTGTFISALQALNTRVSSLADVARTATLPASWDAVTASSSAPSVTTTTTAAASPGVLPVRVEQLAKHQVGITAQFTSPSEIFGPSVPLKLSVTHGSTTTAVEAKSGSLADVTAALNAAGTGVTAVAVKVADGTPPAYRLQVSGTESGSAAGFSISRADTGATIAMTTVQPAQDARVRLFGDASDPASATVHSSTNTFPDIVPGLSFTVSKVETEPVTLSVVRDDAAVKKLASGIVGALGIVLSEISSRTATTTTTASDGRTIVTGGVLSADSAVRGLRGMLVEATTRPVGSTSPAAVGIILGRDGTVTFDEAKFTAAMAADPTKVESMVSAIAVRVEKAARNLSDPLEGSLTVKITSQQGFSRQLADQVLEWDRRLDMRRQALQRTYSALEVSLSGLRAQSSWLSSQLASLPTASGS